MMETITTIELEKLFNTIAADETGYQKKVEWPCALGVYYGLNSEGRKRISFLSSQPAPKLVATRQLNVVQAREGDFAYWTCFDLTEAKANKVFYSFCSSLLDAVKNVSDESEAAKRLKQRYLAWKSLFERQSSGALSREVVQGLFGELYFLKKVLAQTNGLSTCVKAWSGPDNASKDFSLNGTWYEIKTVGVNSVSVKINSLGQLCSTTDGHLVVIKAELMSPEFSNGESSVGELFDYILNNLNDEDSEKFFISKMSSFGINSFDDECLSTKFDVKNVSSYKVGDGFPLIDADEVGKHGIVDVSYSVLISAIEPFKED